mgnify:CR=1 FL=1
MPETIIQKESVTLYKEDMFRYGIETNRRRSVADARDGLKLVQRRILDVMYMNEPCATKFVKTAAVVGTVMKKSHPHGDSSIKDAIKPMVNWWEIGMPLVDTMSNFGSMQGAGAAAPRYTEIKLSDFCLDCVIGDLRKSKGVVDWVDTFDYRDVEPEYLPVGVPLLLINGTYGLGVGLRAEIPKHNINEVIDATIKLIKDPNATIVLVPDHCMPCEIVETNWKKISNTGHGNYKVRGIIDIESKGDNTQLVIRSVPDRVYFDRGAAEKGGVKYKILDMVKEGKLPQVTAIEEHSKGDDMRIVIKLRKGSDPNYVRDMIYKNTQMEGTYTVNFEVLNGIEPLRMSYKSYLEFFIEQRMIIKFRMYANRLQEVNTRYHKIKSYVEVLESNVLDQILEVIKKQKEINDDNLVETLIKKFGLTDIQATFIINSTYKTRSIAYINAYKKEMADLSKKLDQYTYMITHDEELMNEIINELLEFKKKYGRPRMCKIVRKNDINNIPEGTFNVVITENNYIRKLSPSDNILTVKMDNPKHVIQVDNTENILIFTNSGKVFNLPVHKIPITERNNSGTDIRILVKGLTSEIIKVMYLPKVKDLANRVNEKYFMTVLTENNTIKKLNLEDFLNVPPSGILFTKLNSNDKVISVAITEDSSNVVIYSDRKALCIPVSQIPHYKRNSLGVAAMDTKDRIDGFAPVELDNTDVVVITNGGRMNKFSIAGLNVSDRYRAGSNVIKLGKSDSIHSIHCVKDSDIISVTTNTGKFEFPVNQLQRGSSISSGEKIVNLKNDMIIKTEIISNPK